MARQSPLAAGSPEHRAAGSGEAVQNSLPGSMQGKTVAGY